MNTKATYLLLAALSVPLATAQTSSQKPVKGVASTVGLYVYPQKQQNAMQQLTDEQQCYGSAKTQTGFDPNATTTVAATKSKRFPEISTYFFGSGNLTPAAFTFKKGIFPNGDGPPLPSKDVSIQLSQAFTGYAVAQVAQPLT